MISFSQTSVASQSDIDTTRAALARWLWPVRFVMVACCVLSLYAAFYGAKTIVPMMAEAFYGHAWWPASDNPLMLLALMAIAGWYVAAFALIVFPLLHTINYIGHTFVLGPYWRLSVLGVAEASEAARLADQAPAVEDYRAAVAGRRGFVVGDLEFMRQLADQARTADCKRQQQAIEAAVLNRLHGDVTRLNNTR